MFAHYNYRKEGSECISSDVIHVSTCMHMLSFAFKKASANVINLCVYLHSSYSPILFAFCIVYPEILVVKKFGDLTPKRNIDILIWR